MIKTIAIATLILLTPVYGTPHYIIVCPEGRGADIGPKLAPCRVLR